jgi:hypothetical protein
VNELRLSRDLTLPLQAVTETFGILGKRGSGKTATSVVLTEQMIRANLPVVVVDPVGVWWGLRYAKDGEGPGLPVVILGGEHGDLPLEAGGGEVLADFIMEHRSPVVVDLGSLRRDDQRDFMIDFASRLYHKNREALHVVLDEADTFIPQRGGDEDLVGAINDIVRKGRARGLGVSLISQRPALISKDVLTQIEVLIALKMTGPQDRDAIQRWVENNAEGDSKGMLESLPVLSLGEAWVWSPGWLKIFKRVQIDARTTFDSSATPAVGARLVAPHGAARVDLAALKAKLGATIERAKEEDPKLLRARIAQLEGELSLGLPGEKRIAELESELAAARESAGVEVPVLDDDIINRVEQAAIALREDASSILHELRANAAVMRLRGEAPGPITIPASAADEQAATEAIARDLARRGELFPKRPMNGGQQQQVAETKQDSAERFSPEPPMVTHGPTGRAGLAFADYDSIELGDRRPRRQARQPSGLGKCERAILGVLAQQGRALTSVQIGVLSGYSSSAGGFRNSLASLRSGGLIIGGNDRVEITSRGIPLAGPVPKMPRPGQPLVRWWLEHRALGKCERLILDALAHVYPKELRSEELGRATQYEPTAGGFRNSLSRLRTLQLVDGWRASRALMEGR